MNRRKFLGLLVATVGVTATAHFGRAKSADTVLKPADDRGGHRGHAHFSSNPKVLIHKPGAPCGCVRCCRQRVGPRRSCQASSSAMASARLRTIP
jgi:hypothetical protein